MTRSPAFNKTGRQFIFYALAGGIATAVDWGSFYGFNTGLEIDYRFAVALSFILGAATNYTLNKTITFRDRTKQIFTQLGIYSAISGFSLLCSVLLMYLQVDKFSLAPFPARMVTTGIMLIANFLMHKFITFNQKVYLFLTGARRGRGVS